MRAWVFDGRDLAERSVPDPVVGRSGLVIEVAAAGLCHSDVHVMSRAVSEIAFPLPVILGHEIAGRVAEIGPETVGVEVGEMVAVHGPRGCGSCPACGRGDEQYCLHARSAGIWPPGLGADGGLAELVHIDHVRHVVPIGDIDPVLAAPLTDAGLTSMNVVDVIRDRVRGGGTVLVIGVGGLGHVAVQLLALLGTVHIHALDLSAESRDAAVRFGAQRVFADVEDLLAHHKSTGVKYAAVLDFAGSPSTVEPIPDLLEVNGMAVLVGVGAGRLPVSLMTMPLGATVHTPYWGSVDQLRRVISLAADGLVVPIVSRYSFDEVPQAYDDLAHGRVLGRAVVV